jgi:hypothetical protein
MAMALGVGGSLYLLRTFADTYAALSVGGFTLLIMVLAWGVALVLGAAFFFALGARPERRENPKNIIARCISRGCTSLCFYISNFH